MFVSFYNKKLKKNPISDINNNKAKAKSRCETILETVSKKYPLTKGDIKDTGFSIFYTYSKQPRLVSVSLAYSDKVYLSSLTYVDFSYNDFVSEEL